MRRRWADARGRSALRVPRVYQGVKAIYGVTLVVDRMNGSRVRVSLYYNKGRLYIAEALRAPSTRRHGHDHPRGTTRRSVSRRTGASIEGADSYSFLVVHVASSSIRLHKLKLHDALLASDGNKFLAR